MTSLDEEIASENSKISSRNLRTLCVEMKDFDDFSKYSAVLDESPGREENPGSSIPKSRKELPVPAVLLKFQNEVDRKPLQEEFSYSDTDEIPATPTSPPRTSNSNYSLRKGKVKSGENEGWIPLSDEEHGSPTKRQKSSSHQRASIKAKKALPSSLFAPKTSVKETFHVSSIFDADEVITKELESLVPKNVDGTQSKRAINKYTVDATKKKKSLGLSKSYSRSVKKKQTNDCPENSSSSVSSIKNYFTPIKKVSQKQSIDDLLNSPPDDCNSVSPSTWSSLSEMTKELKKLCRESREKQSQFEEVKKNRKDYQESSSKMRDELHSKLNSDGMKTWVLENEEFINNIWSGDIESSRYEAYHRSTEARHGLLYHMITHPYNDLQIEALLEAITQKWMQSSELINERSDFVWKVVMPEVLIKIYMETFNISNKNEAEKRIALTPLESDDDDNHW